MKRPHNAWMTAARIDAPDAKSVHVLRTRLVCDKLAHCRTLLSPDEQARAGRFVFDDDRRRFSVARAALRQILGMYLVTDPASIAFKYGDNGKPALAEPVSDIEFNLSHTEDIAVYVVTRKKPAGVDVESLSAGRDSDRIAERFFTPLEQQALRQLPADQRARAFISLWTRKEAYLKACGEGLFTSPAVFETTLDDPPRILSVGGDAGIARDWTCLDFVPTPGYAAAVVIQGKTKRMVCYDWVVAGS